MLHSVIIPHRGRPRHLALCLWALERSARVCGVTEWEPVVCDDPTGEEPYNKSRALNHGIDQARGELLTFLDVDAVVGRLFLEAARCLEDGDLDRCCYRVRTLPLHETLAIEVAEDREAYVDELFAEYVRYPLAFEAYGKFDIDQRRNPCPSGQPWGNSQFSILRSRLGDVRYDEQIGWAAEDLDMNMQLQIRFGLEHRARIFTDPGHAMLHLEHSGHPWEDRNFGSQRLRLRMLKRKRLLNY